jgi:hypothetical protein
LIKKKNLHLIISSITIVIIAFTYGLFPDKSLPDIFDFTVETVDLKQILRATMGLYLGMGILWIIGVLKTNYWRMATLSNVLFMLGLASGRIMSLLADGIPSIYFVIGLGLEFTFAIWGIKNLYKTSEN